MSGIAGIYYLDGKQVDRSDLGRMVQSMAHRGPDGCSVWCEGSVGFGHCMLHTTPESLHEKLPLTDATGRFTITADARIDNRDELYSQLRIPGPPSRVSDSELILAAYQKWCGDCVDHLLGDFAFAIWDAQEQRLFCARDHLGLRPFYYVHQPGQFFAFSTEIKALLRLDFVPEEICEIMLAYYLTRTSEEHELTIYEKVLRLPRAHKLSLTSDKFRLEQYWTLDLPDVLELDSDEAYAEQFAEIFEEAVRCRTRSGFPVGAQLSGGLDSSYVSCIARNVLSETQRSLHTFSMIFGGDEDADEKPFIEAVALQDGFIPHFIRGGIKGPLSDLEKIYDILDDGVIGGNHISNWEMMIAANAAGVRALLDGLDGDSTVGHGYSIFGTLARQQNWGEFSLQARLAAENLKQSHCGQYRRIGEHYIYSVYNEYALPEVKRLAERGRWLHFLRALKHVSAPVGRSRMELARRYWRRLLLPRVMIERRDQTTASTEKALSFIHPEFAKRLNIRERLQGVDDPYQSQGLGMRERQRRLHLSGKRARVFEMANHLSAAFSMELRHPFMDIRLIKFCLSLPESQSFNNGWTRVVMRRAMEGSVPSRVSWRPDKADLGNVFRDGLLRTNAVDMRGIVYAHDLMDDYIDKDALRRAYKDRGSLTDHDLTNFAATITLTGWLKHRFVGGKQPVNTVAAESTPVGG